MARQSRWQQFANNFNSTYGTVTGVAKDFETARVMNQDFEDEEGNPLSGDALRQRRYEGLADVYTKYGDAEGALGLLSSQEQLRGARLDNDVAAATKDERIANAGLQNDALRARIGATNRSGRGGGRLSRREAEEARRRSVLSAVYGTPAPGGAAAGATENASGAENSGPRRESPTRLPGGLTAPAAPSTLPRTDRTSSRQGRPPPTVSSRGALSGDQLEGGAGSDTLGGGAPSAPNVGSTAPSQPAAPKPTELIAEGIRQNNGKQPGKKTVRQATAAANENASTRLEQAVNGLLAVGDIDGASKLVNLTNSLGEAKADALTRDADRLGQLVDAAATQAGARGVVGVLDDYNGPTRDIALEQVDGRIVAMEYMRDSDGNRVATRELASGRSEEELTEQLVMLSRPVENRIEFAKQKADLAEAQAEAVLARNKAPGETFIERALWMLERDPYNAPVIQAYASKLGVTVEEVESTLGEWRARADEEARRQIEQAAGGGVSGETGRGGADAAPAPPSEEQPETQTQSGLSDEPAIEVGENAARRAMQIYGQIWRREFAARGAGSSGLASNPELASADPATITEMVYQAMKRDPELGQLRDEALRELARQTVVVMEDGGG